MRLTLKILAAPFALLFTVLAFFFAFVLGMSKIIFGIASGLVFIISVVLFITGEPAGGIAFMVIAFLVSPYGLPALAEKVAEWLAGLGGRLQGFITS